MTLPSLFRRRQPYWRRPARSVSTHASTSHRNKTPRTRSRQLTATPGQTSGGGQWPPVDSRCTDSVPRPCGHSIGCSPRPRQSACPGWPSPSADAERRQHDGRRPLLQVAALVVREAPELDAIGVGAYRNRRPLTRKSVRRSRCRDRYRGIPLTRRRHQHLAVRRAAGGLRGRRGNGGRRTRADGLFGRIATVAHDLGANGGRTTRRWARHQNRNPTPIRRSPSTGSSRARY